LSVDTWSAQGRRPIIAVVIIMKEGRCALSSASGDVQRASRAMQRCSVCEKKRDRDRERQRARETGQEKAVDNRR